MSAATLLEASMVIETRKGEAGEQELDLFIYRAGIEIVPVDQEQAEVARIAWRQYGKGRHPAGLNSDPYPHFTWPVKMLIRNVDF